MSEFFDDFPKTNSIISLVECLTLEQNSIFKKVVDNYHSYVKYTCGPTRRIQWLVYETISSNLVGAIGISSAMLALSSRDEYIGWNSEQRIKNNGMLANNFRFALIRKNFTIKNIGSATLKQLRIAGAKRWEEKYNQPLIMLETFVLEEREEELDGYKKRNGSTYLADNWLYIGYTKGNSIRKAPTKLWAKENSIRGELARTNPKEAWEKYGYGGVERVIEKTQLKMVFIKPLVKNWKELLMK